MVTKQKHFLDSLRQMVSKPGINTCPTCQREFEGDACPGCQNADPPNEPGSESNTATAYLVDLVSNHKIRIPSPLCKVGRDESNDIVVSGDQSISRHHLSITHDGDQYHVEDGGSRHGTFLNGTQIKTKERISDGDVIKIGVSLFWFVIENGSGENAATGNTSIEQTEPSHLTVKSDVLNEPSDPSTSTMNDIPAMPNEQTLMDKLRLKTRSFEQSGLFAHTQSQPGAIGGLPDTSKSGNEQIVLPALESPTELTNSSQASPPTTHPQQMEDLPAQIEVEPQILAHTTVPTLALADGNSIYDQLMNTDLAELIDKYNELKHKIDEAQNHMEQIAGQLNAIRSLGTSLIGGSGNPLVEACAKVLSQLGWQVTSSNQDQQELQLRQDSQLSIARIIWTSEEPERSHLGQLSISQTNHWCQEGQEPKGILIISRLSDRATGANLTNADYESELTNYAAKKNVCMMTSVQVLAIYRDLVLKNTDPTNLREKIMSTNGWLDGFAIKTHH